MGKSFTVDKEFLLFRDGTVALLNTSWDIEKKMRAADKGEMEYAVAVLHSDDVFSPVDSWNVQWPEQLPDWLALAEVDHRMKSDAKKWAKRHVFQNRRLPVRASKPREDYYVRNCRSVHLTGYKTIVMAAGDTRVDVKNAETSVYLLDKKVKLNKNRFMIPETTNVYTFFDSPIVTAGTVSQPAVTSASPKNTSISLNELRIDEQLKQISWMREDFEHEDIAYSFGTHKSIQEFINGFQAGSKNQSSLSEGSDQFKIGVIFGQSPDREGLLELLERCPAQLRTDLQLVSICDQISRIVEQVSFSDRERAIPASLKDSFDRYEQGTAFGCLPVYAAEKFSSNVIHYNESMTVQGGGETYCLSVFCNNRRYSLNHISEEKCVTETEKLLKFARKNGYSIEKYTGRYLNLPNGTDAVKHAEADTEQETKYLQELGITYTCDYYDDGYYNGYRYSFHKDHSDAASEYDGCLSAGEQFNRGMRPELHKIGLTDPQIDALRDKNNGPIAGLITKGDLYYETADISSLIANADGSFRKSQVMTSLLQPDLQESADLAL